MMKHLLVTTAVTILSVPQWAAGEIPHPAAPGVPCGVESQRENSAKANGDFLEIQTSTIQTSKGCGSSSQGNSPSPSPPSTLITSTDTCDPAQTTGIVNIAVACLGQAARDLQSCDPDLGFTIDPTTLQTLQPDGTYSEPTLNSVLACNQPPTAAPLVLTQADFRTLPLSPSAIVVGPPQGWVPVNMITVVYTDAHPQVLTTTLLGQPVTVRATPARFVWDWADGSTPTATTDPGAPWPHHTIAYTYPRTGTYTVTMTTTWTGEYSLDGGTTYTPITGTATTLSTAPPLTVKELRSHLVEDPLS